LDFQIKGITILSISHMEDNILGQTIKYSGEEAKEIEIYIQILIL
jgi:hypothetical protein